jgi:hypothetical protein
LEKLKKESREIGGLTLSRRALDGAIDFSIKKGWLVLIPQEAPHSDLVAARHTILMEKLCIQKMKQGQNQLTPILSRDSPLLTEVQEHQRLTKGQKEAVTLMLSSPDKISAIQGIAGAGKTTALKEVKRLCEDSNFKSLVLANTASAKNQAKQSSGIVSQTTAQFLTRVETLVALDPDKAKKDYGENQLIILDEASLIATKEQFRLTNLVEQLGTRLSLVGDFKQQGSIGAGTGLRDLLAYEISKAVMTENVRLNDGKALAAMKRAYAGDMAGTLQSLKDTIEEIPDKKEALIKIANIYRLIPKKDREHVLIIMPRNEDRRFVNNAIRDKLIENEELTGNRLKTSIFLPRDRREVDKKEIASFKLDDVIRFNTRHARLGIEVGDYLKVVEIDKKHHRLTLQRDDGQSLYWMPKNLRKVSDIEIYKQEERELMKNDLIIFKRNQEEKDIFNGDKASILNVIGDHQIEVLLLSGKSTVLDLSKKENQHLDYGYALTTFVAQGKDVVLVLAYGEGPQPYLRKISDLKIGDKVVLTKEDQKQSYPAYQGHSIVGEIVKIEDLKLTLRKEDKIFSVNIDKGRDWNYYPPFEERKDYELPLSTSQQSWLIEITRGDMFYAIVPYLSDFQKTLERHETTKQSALSVLDPRYSELDNRVKRLVDNIKGKVGVEPIQSSPENTILKDKTVEHQSFFQGSKKFFIDKDEVNAHLQRDILGYASRWLGSPKKMSGGVARWSGALTVTYRGSKAGGWKRWSADKGGKDLISLYAHLYSLSWKDALNKLAKDLGFSQGESSSYYKKVVHQYPSAEVIQQEEERAKQRRITKALKIYEKSLPLSGTIAQKYLKDHRGIGGPLPSDFKFNPGTNHLDTQRLTPALVAPIRDKYNNITGIVRIFLNSDGSKLKETYRDEAGELKEATDKISLGIVKGGSVVVQHAELDTTVWVAEGIETALSVATAIPYQTVMATTGVEHFKNLDFNPEVQKIVICADRDEPGSNTPQALIKAIENHLLQGRRVFIAIPDGKEKCDFNDLLQQGGVISVKTILDNRLEIKRTELLQMKEVGFLETIEKMKGLKQDTLNSPALAQQATERNLER